MILCSAVFDIGTSSLKGALIDKDGKVYKQGRLFFPPKVIAENWIISFENLFKQFSDFANLKNIEICGICISGNGPSLVSVSKNSKKLLLWNREPNYEPQNKDAKNIHSIFLPRFELFKSLYSTAYAEADFIFSGQEFLIYELTKNTVTTMPEKRYEKAYWNDESLKIFNIEKNKIPPFVKPGTNCGFYRDIPVFAGTPDFIAGLIGTNTLKPGKACDRAGSSEGVNICIEKIPPKEKLQELLVLPSPVFPYWNVSFKITNSGNIFFNYLKENGGSFLDFDSFMKSIKEIPRSVDGNYPNTIAGKGRQIVETLAREIRRGMDLLENATGYKPTYTLCGGQAKSKLWCELKEEITGRNFQHLQIDDAELLGNACIVFTALGKYKNISTASDSIGIL